MRFRILASVAVAAISLMSTSTSYADADKSEPLKVGALRLASHSPTFIAENQGYFQQHGLTTELVFFQAAQPMALAIASGDVDGHDSRVGELGREGGSESRGRCSKRTSGRSRTANIDVECGV